MEDHLDLLNALHRLGFYEATLFLSEYFYLQNNEISVLYFILSSLHKLNYNQRVFEICNGNKGILKYYEIKILYLKVIAKLRQINKNIIFVDEKLENVYSTIDINFSSYTDSFINAESILLYHKGIASQAHMKKKLLIKAYEIDNKNFAALFELVYYKLICKADLKNIINASQCSEYGLLYKNIFDFYNKKNIEQIDFDGNIKLNTKFLLFNDYSFLQLGKFYFKKKMKEDLFGLSVFLSDNYPENYMLYLILGFYYFLFDNINNAKVCLEKARSRTSHPFPMYFFGHVNRLLWESSTAISLFLDSEKEMLGSYKPLLNLGLYYVQHKMFNKAYIPLKRAFDMKKCENTFYALYSVVLMRNEQKKLDEVVWFLQKNDYKKQDFVLVCKYFILISDEKLKEAHLVIQDITVYWVKVLLQGFLFHMQQKKQEAVKNYIEAKINCCVPLIDDLLQGVGDSDNYKTVVYENELSRSLYVVIYERLVGWNI